MPWGTGRSVTATDTHRERPQRSPHPAAGLGITAPGARRVCPARPGAAPGRLCPPRLPPHPHATGPGALPGRAAPSLPGGALTVLRDALHVAAACLDDAAEVPGRRRRPGAARVQRPVRHGRAGASAGPADSARPPRACAAAAPAQWGRAGRAGGVRGEGAA